MPIFAEIYDVENKHGHPSFGYLTLFSVHGCVPIFAEIYDVENKHGHPSFGYLTLFMAVCQYSLKYMMWKINMVILALVI